jgi:hypothetical protein
VEQYDSQKREGGLFVDYINTFLKFKTETSGYPTWVKDGVVEEKYIRDLHAKHTKNILHDTYTLYGAVRKDGRSRGVRGTEPQTNNSTPTIQHGID